MVCANRVYGGLAAGLAIPNIDTDTIIPIDYCVNRKRPHFDEGLFRHWRFESDGGLKKDFILNRKPFLNSKVLVVGPNFGCGSSREMAVWALKDFGIDCIIAESFGEIFYNNCFQNQVLAVTVSQRAVTSLLQAIGENMGLVLTIDVDRSLIESDVIPPIPFVLDALRQDMLIQRLEPIEATFERERDILRFEKNYFSVQSWSYLVD